MTLRTPTSIEEMLYSYIAHVETVASNTLKNPLVSDADYELVIAEHNLFAARIAATRGLPPSITIQCAKIQLPRRPAHPKDWRDVLAMIGWMLGRIPGGRDDRDPHSYYRNMLENYVEDLRGLRKTTFFAYNDMNETTGASTARDTHSGPAPGEA